MFAKKLTGVALLLVALLLTGCGGEIVTDLYVQDILDVVSGEEESLFTTATITLESPGEEYNEQLMSLIAQNFRDAGNFRTTSQEFSTYISVDVKVPIVLLDNHEALWSEEDSIGIVVMDLEDGDYGFGLALNSYKLDEMFSALEEELWFSVGIEDFSFTVRLVNDLRESINVLLQGVYANNVPLAYEEIFEMARRDIIEIRLSDVLRDHAYEEWMVLIGVFGQ